MYASGGLGQFELEGSDESLRERLQSSVDAAVDYLRDRWDAFLNLSPRIIDLQHEAAVAGAGFKQAGDLERHAQAQEIIRKLGELNQLHDKLVGKMAQVADVVGVGGMLSGYRGLGAIPAAQVTVITGLALGVAYFFRAANLQQTKLDMLREGFAPEDIEGVGDAGPPPILAGVGDITRWVVLGIGLWAAYQLIQGAGGLRAFRGNPPLVVYDTNPPGGVIGEEVLAVWYQHAEDGGLYVHEFGDDVELVAQEDGTVCMQHPDKPLWEDFR